MDVGDEGRGMEWRAIFGEVGFNFEFYNNGETFPT